MASNGTNTDNEPDNGPDAVAGSEDTTQASAATTTGATAAHAADTSAASGVSTSDSNAKDGSERGVVSGALAVISAGLGFASLTGTTLGEMMRNRSELIGQIEASAGGGGGDQIQAIYGTPWHTAAMVNGIFAVLAVVVGGLLLAVLTSKANSPGWVKAVALGGFILGLLGFIVAGGMALDLFAAPPVLPGAGG